MRKSHGNKGSIFSKEHKEKIRLALLGKNKNKPAWNKGLTKDTDERVAKYSKSLEGHTAFGGLECRFKKGNKRSIQSRLRQAETVSGENNANWKGGVSFEPYCPKFNKKLRTQIRKRDGYKCGICGKSAKVIHHIDYDKKNSNPLNLITLCWHCHGKTNYNRQSWIEYFKEKEVQYA